MQPQSLSPVSKVLLWKNAESKESIHSLEMRLQHKFYAKKLAKKWSASVKMYRQTVHTETEDRTSMLLLQLGISECVWIMDQQHIVQTDASMERIVNTLKNQWSMRQAIFIEGSEWSMGDVVVRLGNVMLGNAFQGAEYLPCQTDCGALMGEFIQSMIPPDADMATSTIEDEQHTTTVGDNLIAWRCHFALKSLLTS